MNALGVIYQLFYKHFNMFQINVSGPEMNPGEIPNPPEHNKKVHLQSSSCTLVHKPLIL